MLKNISVSCQTTDGLLNPGQLEYHIFITAINIPAHHQHLYHHMCTLQISAVQRPQAPSPLAPMLHCFAEAVATAQRSSGGGCTPHHWRLLRSAAVAGTAAQCSSGGHRRAAQQRRPPRSGAACHKFQHAAPVRGPTIWILKKMRGQGWSRGGAGGGLSWRVRVRC